MIYHHALLTHSFGRITTLMNWPSRADKLVSAPKRCKWLVDQAWSCPHIYDNWSKRVRKKVSAWSSGPLEWWEQKILFSVRATNDRINATSCQTLSKTSSMVHVMGIQGEICTGLILSAWILEKGVIGRTDLWLWWVVLGTSQEMDVAVVLVASMPFWKLETKE